MVPAQWTRLPAQSCVRPSRRNPPRLRPNKPPFTENFTMRLLLFVSAFGILISLAVLIMVIMKAKKDSTPPKMKPSKDD
jgi:hypothetical protein